MALLHSPRIVTDGLVLCLDAASRQSYPGSGTVWRDLAGSNNGTLTNGPTFSSANGGNIVFDGSNDFIEIAETTSITQITTNVTVSMWIFNSIWKEANFIEGGTSGLVFWSTPGYDNKLRWGLQNSGSQNVANRNFSQIINTWYNIVGTYNGSQLRFYYNGVLDSITNASILFTNNSYKIGTGVDGYMNGRVSSVSIYNRALTPIEILQNYNATKGRFSLA
jgi:hypothetical protein